MLTLHRNTRHKGCAVKVVTSALNRTKMKKSALKQHDYQKIMLTLPLCNTFYQVMPNFVFYLAADDVSLLVSSSLCAACGIYGTGTGEGCKM